MESYSNELSTLVFGKVENVNKTNAADVAT